MQSRVCAASCRQRQGSACGRQQIASARWQEGASLQRPRADLREAGRTRQSHRRLPARGRARTQLQGSGGWDDPPRREPARRPLKNWAACATLCIENCHCPAIVADAAYRDDSLEGPMLSFSILDVAALTGFVVAWAIYAI